MDWIELNEHRYIVFEWMLIEDQAYDLLKVSSSVSFNAHWVRAFNLISFWIDQCWWELISNRLIWIWVNVEGCTHHRIGYQLEIPLGCKCYLLGLLCYLSSMNEVSDQWFILLEDPFGVLVNDIFFEFKLLWLEGFEWLLWRLLLSLWLWTHVLWCSNISKGLLRILDDVVVRSSCLSLIDIIGLWSLDHLLRVRYHLLILR